METDTPAPQLIQLGQATDKRGSLSFFENNNQIPFAIKRTHWVYGVQEGESRYGHASHNGKQFVVALSGGFNVMVDDGGGRQVFDLSGPYYGLYIPPMHWWEMSGFAASSLALVVSSQELADEDQIHTYDRFCVLRGAHAKNISL